MLSAREPLNVPARTGTGCWHQCRGLHYVLNALIDKRLAKLGKLTATEDKRRYAYLLTLQGTAEKNSLTKRFSARKIAEYRMLKAEVEAIFGNLSDTEMSEFKAVLDDK